MNKKNKKDSIKEKTKTNSNDKNEYNNKDSKDIDINFLTCINKEKNMINNIEWYKNLIYEWNIILYYGTKKKLDN